MPSDLTLINLNLLFIRYGEQVERERHVPLGCLYLTRALEAAGFTVDFRDYQLCESEDPFDLDAFLNFAAEPAPVIGLSCMANLLPFTLLAAEALKARYPDRKVVLGGVGTKAVEDKILRRFPAIDVIARGEGEETGPELLRALKRPMRSEEDQKTHERDNSEFHRIIVSAAGNTTCSPSRRPESTSMSSSKVRPVRMVRRLTWPTGELEVRLRP